MFFIGIGIVFLVVVIYFVVEKFVYFKFDLIKYCIFNKSVIKFKSSRFVIKV